MRPDMLNWELLNQYGRVLPWWAWVIVLVLACIAVWSIFQFRAWFREGDGRAADNSEMLMQFRELHRQGDLSEEEYRLIKDRLVRASGPKPAGQRAPSVSPAKIAASRGMTNAHNDGPNDESRTDDKPPTMESANTNATETNESGRNPDAGQ